MKIIRVIFSTNLLNQLKKKVISEKLDWQIKDATMQRKESVTGGTFLGFRTLLTFAF